MIPQTETPITTREDLIEYLTKTQEDSLTGASVECQKKSLRGNILFAIFRASLHGVERSKFIRVFSLRKNRPQKRWEYEAFDENEEVPHYNCPLKYFKLVPEGSDVWRRKVRAYHKKRRSVPTTPLHVGDVVFFSDPRKVAGEDHSSGTIAGHDGRGYLVKIGPAGELRKMFRRDFKISYPAGNTDCKAS